MKGCADISLIEPLSWIASVHVQGSSDASAVRGVVASLAEACNQHDMDTLGKLFAPDAYFINVGGYKMKGSDLLRYRSLEVIDQPVDED